MPTLLHLSFPEGAIFRVFAHTYHLLCRDIFSSPLVKPSSVASSEKPSLTTSFTLSFVYVYLWAAGHWLWTHWKQGPTVSESFVRPNASLRVALNE